MAAKAKGAGKNARAASVKDGPSSIWRLKGTLQEQDRRRENFAGHEADGRRAPTARPLSLGFRSGIGDRGGRVSLLLGPANGFQMRPSCWRAAPILRFPSRTFSKEGAGSHNGIPTLGPCIRSVPRLRRWRDRSAIVLG